MPGPPPKSPDQRRRRNAAPGSTALPAGGRSGPVPPWPLSGEAPPVWAELWRAPQAVEWERLALQRPVARYARCLVASEEVDAPATLLGEVRQLEDRLGLSPMAMRRLLWEVADEAPATVEGKPTGTGRARDRLRSVG